MSDPHLHIEVLAKAIKTKSALLVFYNDKSRLIEPHTLGFNKNQEPLIRVYQPHEIEGSTQGWKLMKVSKIDSVWAAEGYEYDAPRPGYKKGDSAMATIMAEL